VNNAAVFYSGTVDSLETDSAVAQAPTTILRLAMRLSLAAARLVVIFCQAGDAAQTTTGAEVASGRKASPSGTPIAVPKMRRFTRSIVAAVEPAMT